jgi:PPOX class probable F420-dependent enzyme
VELTSALSTQQRAYLDRNLLAVLGTSRRDGSPQLSTVHFSVLDDGVYVGVGRGSAKWHNAGREPRVALIVNEGASQLVIYGRAERVGSDPERLDRYRAHRTNTAGKGSDIGVPPEGDAFRAQLDEGNRALLRITPERVLGLE